MTDLLDKAPPKSPLKSKRFWVGIVAGIFSTLVAQATHNSAVGTAVGEALRTGVCAVVSCD